MRQQQNNKNRMRGRGRNKQSNSINRNYESNGPDVKIRGNAAHIAEKYATLARDAQSSGDSVIAENYLQHAEHYNRIVLAAQAQREEAQANRARQNDAAQDEQPDVNDGDRPEAVSAGARDDGNEDGERKSVGRRGRNANGRAPRKRDADGDGDGVVAEAGAAETAAEAGNEAGQAEEAAKKPSRPRRTTRAKSEPAGEITEDAASLPQGLLGGGAGQPVAAEE